MSVKTAIHTFQKGMVKDLDKSVISNGAYLEARNKRLVTSEGESSGALENVEGLNNIYTTIAPGATLTQGHKYVVVKGTATYNSVSYTLTQSFTCVVGVTTFSGTGALVVDANEFMENNMFIVGSATVRNTIVLFITDNTSATPTAGHSKIVKLTIAEGTETIATKSVLYDDNLNNNTGYLKFSTANPIKAVAVYESASIQKIYWCDGYNNVRYANTAAYLTTDETVYTGTNYYFEPDLFEFLPEVTYSARPTLDYLMPGSITAGMVQYSFQYYNNHGAETALSPLSNIIHITTDNDYTANSFDYAGEGDLNKTTGKSVRMLFTLANASKFSHIRIFRLHYTTVNSLPTITNIGEIAISDSLTNVTFTDNGGVGLGTLTIDQFNLGETELFSAKDIAIKSNRLFAANIVKEDFTITGWDARAVRFDVAPTPQAKVTDSTLGDVTIDAPSSDTPAEWDTANWDDYVATHDGINPFNDPANDAVTANHYKYQKNGTTLGAEGPNLTIGFALDTMVIDNASSANTFSCGLESTTDNKSFTSFASPYLSGRRSWQRDEVYRLFLVFFNAHGVASNPQWVCDLRMPSLHDSGYHVLGSLSGSVTSTTALYPTITLKSLPTGAVSAQLLRVERGGEDRSILTQAYAIPVKSVSAAARPVIMSDTMSNTGGMVKLVSPEINITKSISKGSSDYMEYVSNYASYYTTTEGTWHRYTRFAVNNLQAFSANCKSTIDNTLYVVPRSNTDTFTFNGVTCANYNSATSAYGSSGLFVHHTNGSWVPGSSATSYNIVNYKRDVHQSQYGGQTFESRESNVAIAASDIMTATATSYTAWNGDTFIDFFEVNNELFDLTKAQAGSYSETIYVPLESSINCALRHDKSASREVSIANSYLMQEVAGKWTSADGLTYSQETSLYQYNTVYSQESNANFYVSVPSTVSTDVEFDCMVRSSKTKIAGESQDSWTLFPVNDFIEVDTAYGPVEAIDNINDKMLFWQDNAFGVLSINERSLVQDQGGSQIVLGTGGILDRYDYISNSIGMTNKLHKVVSQTGVYWLSTKDRSIYKFAQSLDNVSKSRLVQSWLEDILTPVNIGYMTLRGAYDKKYNEVLFSFYNSNTVSGETLVFSESMDVFTGYYDFYTSLFIPYSDNFLSTFHVYNTDFLFYHNSRLKDRCCFRSVIPAIGDLETLNPTPGYVDSSVKVLFNDEYNYTKVYDNLSFVSHAYSNGVELYNNTFSSVRCYNNYQNSDFCNLELGNTATTGNISLQRDEREWTSIVPRNAINKLYTTSPDVFNPANLTKSRVFKERIRDKYMIADFVYDNTGNRRFVVPYVAAKYRISYR